MSNLLAQVSFAADSGLARDRTVNTFHFGTSGAGVDVAQSALIDAALQDFYTGIHAPGTAALRTFFSGSVAQNGHTTRIYRLEDVTPRVPIYESVWNLAANPGGQGLPQEVALCLSIQAAYVSGTPNARKRNRIYFGPIAASALTARAGTNVPIPDPGLMDALRGAASDLLLDSNAAADWSWVVLSQATGALVAAPVVGGWVDDEFDTQRRRGSVALQRLTWA